MQIGAILSPVADGVAILEAARQADRAGLDAIGLWDHYHSPRPGLGYVAGWAMLGALAAVTTRVRIVPMVLNNLHYQLGVLAKESSVIAAASDGRFELGIGAGDWPESFRAWGEAFPPTDDRLGRLRESLKALLELWRGDAVTMMGEWVRLDGAISTPAPTPRPRIVIGVGSSRRALAAVGPLADEVNVYAGDGMIEAATEVRRADGSSPAVSVFLSWEWDKWPADPGTELDLLEHQGATRAFVSLGAERDAMRERIGMLAELSGRRSGW